MKLEGKIALVTGGSGGIGAAISGRLAAGGATVNLTYRSNRSNADLVVSKIGASNGKAFAHQCDLNQIDEVTSLFKEVKESHGKIDILVNCAGIAALTPLSDLKIEDYDRVFSVNVRSLIWATHLAFSHLSPNGRIINISSATVKRPSAGIGVYIASKAAVNSLTEVASKEFGELGITVNAIMPGPTIPGMFQNMPDHIKELEAKRSPFNRVGTAEEIADVVSFLSSEEGRWITGQIIAVDGGSYS